MITMQIRKGTENDIEEVAVLYDTLNDYLESHTYYPGWIGSGCTSGCCKSKAAPFIVNLLGRERERRK